MAKVPLIIGNWSGGQSQDDKEGIPNSFAYSRHVEFRKSPTTLTVLPETRKDSGTTITDLPVAGLQLPSGKKVFIDKAGGAYYRTTAGVWSKLSGSLGTVGMGMIYNPIHDTIYIPTLSTISTITGADGVYGGTPTIVADSFTANQDQSGGTAANTYTTTAAVSEAAADLLSFVPAADPLHSIKLWVTTKGTADVRVVIHDAANNIIATKDLTAAAMTNGALNEWLFATDARLRAGGNASTYHVHAYNPGAGTATTLGVSTASNFSTAMFATFASRLVTPRNGFHPALEFANFYAFGNGNYLTTWEPISQSAPVNTEWVRHRLTFPLGYEVTSLALYSEYIAIACEKRSSTSTEEFQDGKIFFWGGTSQLVDFTLDVPEGAPYSIFSAGNRLFYWADGSWWMWSGQDPVRVQQLPNTDGDFTDTDYYTVNYPNMHGIRKGIVLGAFPSETNNLTLEHGVYSFGARNRLYPEAFGLHDTISTGSRLNTGSNNLRIGMLKTFGNQTYMGWRDGANYGMDIIDNDSDPYGSGEWQSLWLDNERADKDKMAVKMVVVFDGALPTGATVTPKFRISRSDSFSVGPTAVATNKTAILDFGDFADKKLFQEIQIGFNFTATATTPSIKKIVLIIDDLTDEVD